MNCCSSCITYPTRTGCISGKTVIQRLYDAHYDRLPTRKLDGTSSSRRVIRGIELRRGDLIQIEGRADGGDTAALDYLEILQPDHDRND